MKPTREEFVKFVQKVAAMKKEADAYRKSLSPEKRAEFDALSEKLKKDPVAQKLMADMRKAFLGDIAKTDPPN